MRHLLALIATLFLSLPAAWAFAGDKVELTDQELDTVSAAGLPTLPLFISSLRLPDGIRQDVPNLVFGTGLSDKLAMTKQRLEQVAQELSLIKGVIGGFGGPAVMKAK